MEKQRQWWLHLRLHAIRYVQEFKRQIEEKGYDLDVLVAFSGEVTNDGVSYNEEGMNKEKNGQSIKEKALPEVFHTDEYGILVVAENIKRDLMSHYFTQCL